MDRIITKIVTDKPTMPVRKRVAAYARVSSGKDAMLHSLSAQVSFYSTEIRKHPDWAFAGVYADEAKTGTKDTRPEFVHLINDCRSGHIDLILTKSVSRFARNTVTLLKTVRELKHLGVDVFFEEQNIHTLSSEGELMLTILAGFAEEESRSVSENMKWRIRKNFEEGIPWGTTIYGYRYEDKHYVIQPDEAAIVRRIFDEYLGGKGATAIANELNTESVPTRRGKEWHKSTVLQILTDYTYTGNLLLQTTFRTDHLSKQRKMNNGELPKFHAMQTHEAIISEEELQAVQEIILKRAKKCSPPDTDHTKRYPLSGLITCGNCGKHYRRKVVRSGPVWICATYNIKGKNYCDSKQIPENMLLDLMSGIDLSTIEGITANNGNEIIVRFRDGQKQFFHWKDRSRSESWTPEMKEQARQKSLERYHER